MKTVPAGADIAAQWDECWSRTENQTWYPDEQVVRFLARYVSRRIGLGVRAVRPAGKGRPAGLDLGCGKGRHVALMSELGIEAFGLDVSSTAAAFARRWLKSRGLAGNVDAGSMERLRYTDGRFDAVLCHGVLDHALADVRERAVAEAERVLKPGGRFFFSVISEKDSAYGHGRKLEADTWLVEDGFEKGIPQAFFTRERIRREFSRFEIESVVLATVAALSGRSLIGTDKHYQTDSRYYVTARRRSR